MGFGKIVEVPPVPYTGAWYPYLFLTCQPAGELYLGLGSYPYLIGGLYRTTNYGDTWEQVLSHYDFGGKDYVPLHLMPVTGGFLVAQWQIDRGFPAFNIYRATAIGGPYTLVLGGVGYDGLWRGFPNFWRVDDGDTIWVSGQRFASGARPQCHKSSDAGQTWAVIFSHTAELIHSQIRVNAAITKGLIGGASAFYASRRSDNPGATPGTWDFVVTAARGHRFGVSWPYCVLVYNTWYWYSSNNGVSGVEKDIPLGMQTGGTGNYYTGIDMSPHDHNLILAAPHGEDAGVWLSKDFGDSWTKVLDDLGPYAAFGAHLQNGVMFDPYNPLKAYAWGVKGFFRSDDAGETWQARSDGLEVRQGLDIPVVESTDDCYTFGTTIRLDREYVYLDSATSDMHGYFRFRDVMLPRGATIKGAWIDLWSYGAYSGSSDLRVLGILEPNTNTFSTQGDADGRPVTTAYVDWTAGSWAKGWRYGYYLEQHDIKSIIQEIIDQDGWAEGNALAIKIINTTKTIARTADAWEKGDHTTAPRLRIDYE